MILDSKKYGRCPIKLKILIKIQKTSKNILIKGDSIEKIRCKFDANIKKMCKKGMLVHYYENIILDFEKDKVKIRVYYPSGEKNLPMIIYLHGGSWIGGNIDTHDSLCRNLCNKSNSVVISVDYKLAPEHKFPIAILDIYKVILWMFKNSEKVNGDNKNISIIGDSAGANLATVVTHYIAKKGGPKINSTVLIYPSVNIYDLNNESWESLGEEVFLKKSDRERFISMYIPNLSDRKNPYASPIYFDDFSNIPPTLLITAEFDPLRDEGYEYYTKLKKNNVVAEYMLIKGVHHGFITMDKFFPEIDIILDKVVKFLLKFNKVLDK